MAGHSKWANIKRRKEKVDAQKGKVFTKLAREIIVAARQGGGDPEVNYRLKAAIQRAKEANIPNENIERAIKRGTGELSGASYEEITYEGYGPGGAAVLMRIVTDNRNRTAAEIRHIFAKNGGNLGEAGCVSWMFEQKGFLILDRSEVTANEDEIMMLALDSGAEDMKTEEDSYEITTAPSDFAEVRAAFEQEKIPLAVAELTMIPKTTVKLSGKAAEQMLKLVEALEEHDDVQSVYSNYEISEV